MALPKKPNGGKINAARRQDCARHTDWKKSILRSKIELPLQSLRLWQSRAHRHAFLVAWLEKA